MTLRARLAALTSTAVALAVLASALAAWFLLRETLLDEIDQQMLERVPDASQLAERTVRFESDDTPPPETRLALQRDLIGVQQLARDGAVLTSVPSDAAPPPLDPAELRLLDNGTVQPHVWTATVDSTSYRVVSVALDDTSLLRMLYPLDRVEDTMTRMAWLLVGVAGAGVAAAGGLGWLTARAGLRPVDRLTAAAEQVATTKDLAHRIEVTGSEHDEVARLARSVNTMLAALDMARTEQRHLVENASHELRTPLTSLRNDIGMLRRAEHHPTRGLDHADRAALLRDLDAETAALSDLVAELVDLARGETDPEPLLETDVRVLVDRAAARTRRLSPHTHVEVHGPGFEAVVRPATLERAVANLLRNAVQVSAPGDPVEVELAEENGWTTVRVLDRGPGIAAPDLPWLFERFYRGTDARERHGSGLGLAIVAQAAEQHGGRAEAANRDGGGAVFTLRVPTHSAPEP